MELSQPVEDEGARDELPAQTQHIIPIAKLEGFQTFTSEHAIKGVVTLIWPYSASTASAAILLTESDFRLRKKKGQVRIQLRGAAAKGIADSGLSIGDSAVLSLEGARWTESSNEIRTPGRSVEGELLYSGRIDIELYRANKSVTHLNIDRYESPPLQDITPNGTPAEPQSTPVRLLHLDTWASPTFMRSASSSQFPDIGSSGDPFFDDEQDDFPDGREKKRPRVWRPSGEWQFMSDHATTIRTAGTVATPDVQSSQPDTITSDTPFSKSGTTVPNITTVEHQLAPMPPLKLLPLKTQFNESLALPLPPRRPTLQAVASPGLLAVSPFITSGSSPSYFAQVPKPLGTPLRTVPDTAGRFSEPAKLAESEPPSIQEHATESQVLVAETEQPIIPSRRLSSRASFDVFRDGSTAHEEDIKRTTMPVGESDVTHDESIAHITLQRSPVVVSSVGEISTNSVRAAILNAGLDGTAETENLLSSLLDEDNGQPATPPAKLSFEDLFNLSPQFSQAPQSFQSEDSKIQVPAIGQVSDEHDVGISLPTPEASQTANTNTVIYSPETVPPTLSETYRYPLLTPQPSDIHGEFIEQSNSLNLSQMFQVEEFFSHSNTATAVETPANDIPEVLSPWFSSRSPSNMLQAKVTSDLPAGVQERIPSTLTRGPTLINADSKKQALEDDGSQQIPKDSSSLSNDWITRRDSTGLRTSVSYYTPLSAVAQHLNMQFSESFRGIDILAIVSTNSTEPARAKAGPKDYHNLYHITDPSIFPQDFRVQCFRPYKRSLPLAAKGDVILLRGFIVKSQKRKCFLISGESSAWLAWRQPQDPQTQPRGDSEWAKEECRGAPVEIGSEERTAAQQLLSWYSHQKFGSQ